MPTTSDAYVSQVRKEIGGLGFAGCIKVDNYAGLVVPDHSDLDLGTSDFTVEGFYYIDDANASMGYHALFDFRGTSGANGQYLHSSDILMGTYIFMLIVLSELTM